MVAMAILYLYAVPIWVWKTDSKCKCTYDKTTQVHIRVCLVHSNHSSIAENLLQKENYVS